MIIKAEKMQHHEKELLRQLEELAGEPISPENAGMIIGVSRRKSSHHCQVKVAPKITLNSNQIQIFIQNGHYYHHISDINKNEIFWLITTFGSNIYGGPQYIISSNVITDEM